MKRFVLLLNIVFIYFYCQVPFIRAQTPPSPTPPYVLFIEPITVSSQLPTDSPFLAANEVRNWNLHGYVIRSHMQGSSTFTIKKTRLAFDTFSPENPRINTTEFSLSSPEHTPYHILLSLVKPLTSTQEQSIAPTSCNFSPKYQCTIRQAAKWEDPAIPGWGFSLKGEAVPTDFKGDEWYRPLTRDESPIILRTYGSEKRNSSWMTWRIQSSERTEGTYSAIVSLTALPY